MIRKCFYDGIDCDFIEVDRLIRDFVGLSPEKNFLNWLVCSE